MSTGVGEAASGPFASGVDVPVVSVGVGPEAAPVSGELGPFASVGVGIPALPVSSHAHRPNNLTTLRIERMLSPLVQPQ